MPPPRLLPLAATALLLALTTSLCTAFTSPLASTCHRRHTRLHALDPVTYLRTEWVSAALCTNQTPRSADTILQLGTFDGRIVNFVPRTVRTIITSSAEPDNAGLAVSTRRQLKQAAEARGSKLITYSDQRADDLVETKDSSVDVVIMFQSVAKMVENGYDWKKAIGEAGRVLKPGGRFLFVESAEVDGESFLEEVMRLSDGDDDDESDAESEEDADDAATVEDTAQSSIIFSEVGFDNVDLVLQPHVAGVAIKAMDADLTPQQRMEKKAREEEDRLADLSLSVFERGNKKSRRRKNKVKKSGFGEKEEISK